MENTAAMKTEMLDELEQLVYCHSTPGDERSVAKRLLDSWQRSGWRTESLGHYAVVAYAPHWDSRRRTILVTAHMDAPGFVIQSITEEGKGVAVTLGYPHVEEPRKPHDVMIKGRRGCFEGTIVSVPPVSEGDDKTAADGKKDRLLVESKSPEDRICRGDRVRYSPCFEMKADGMLEATSLDNRIGCWALCRLAEVLGNEPLPVNVVLGATAEEEMTGFGANVLAAAVPHDLALCLDATYADDEQGVRLGGGVVLTVSDKSTIVSPEVCGALENLCASWGLKLQEEYYNYSGTDAQAFPKAGRMTPVLALLVATTGNHTPREIASLEDLSELVALLQSFCRSQEGIETLLKAWAF